MSQLYNKHKSLYTIYMLFFFNQKVSICQRSCHHNHDHNHPFSLLYFKLLSSSRPPWNYRIVGPPGPIYCTWFIDHGVSLYQPKHGTSADSLGIGPTWYGKKNLILPFNWMTSQHSSFFTRGGKQEVTLCPFFAEKKKTPPSPRGRQWMYPLDTCAWLSAGFEKPFLPRFVLMTDGYVVK